MKIQYLGTAAAEGWPAVFCHCPVCEEARRRGGRDIRTRSQALVNDDLLIDFPPDTYWHSIAHGVDLSAIRCQLLTHSHMDHMFPQEFVLRGGCYAHDMRVNDLDIIGTQYTKNTFDKISSEEMESGIAALQHWRIAEPYVTIESAGYRITALPAKHMLGKGAVNYLIQRDGKALLYLHDTGIPYDEVFEFLAHKGTHLDLVSLDCTSGPREEGEQGGHMGIPDGRKVKGRLEDAGISTDQTTYVINHFSHNCKMLYDDLCEEVRKDGFLVSFDGRVVEF